MIADIVAYLFCNDVALVSVCYSYLGFTFTSSPGTGKPGKAQQTHTIDTLRYNIIMEFTCQPITQKVEWQNLSFIPCDVKMTCKCVFLGGPTPKNHWRIRKASFPSAVHPPTLGVHRLRRIPVWVERSGQKAAMERLQALGPNGWRSSWKRINGWNPETALGADHVFGERYGPVSITPWLAMKKQEYSKATKMICKIVVMEEKTDCNKKLVKQQHAEDETISQAHSTLPGAIPPVFYRGP